MPMKRITLATLRFGACDRVPLKGCWKKRFPVRCHHREQQVVFFPLPLYPADKKGVPRSLWLAQSGEQLHQFIMSCQCTMSLSFR